MKKVLFFVAAAIAVATTGMFTSCTSKEVKKVGEYELTEANGKVGLKNEGGSVVLAPEFDEIENKEEYKAVFAKQGDLTSIVVNSSVVASGINIESVDACEDNAEYAYIKADGKKMLWKIGSSSTYGPFEDIKLIDDIVFMLQDGKWGAATLDLRGLAPRKFDRVLIVKNDPHMAVLVKDAKGWSMFDADGVSNGQRYDTNAKTLDKQVKALKCDDAIAVVKVNWKL